MSVGGFGAEQPTGQLGGGTHGVGNCVGGSDGSGAADGTGVGSHPSIPVSRHSSGQQSGHAGSRSVGIGKSLQSGLLIDTSVQRGGRFAS